MKIVESVDASGTLADYAAQIGAGPVIVTNQGRPVAALVAIENADLETVTLSSNPQFVELIERSRSSVISSGTISAEDMRKKFS
jgi:antitoxin (DNA-binding transcriptional repressor) of toxin-antitoxin stability system